MALVVLGLVLVGIAGGVQFGLRAADTQSRADVAQADLAGVDRTLRRLIAGMDPGAGDETPPLTAEPGRLSFVTDLDGQSNVALGVDAAHRLILRSTPYIHAVRLAPPPPPTSTVVLDDVERIEFSYWGASGGWQSSWSEKTLPRLVRIRLHFSEGSRKSWPEIVAATQRSTAGG